MEYQFETRYYEKSELSEIWTHSDPVYSRYISLHQSNREYLSDKIFDIRGDHVFTEYVGYTYYMVIAVLNYLPLLNVKNPSITDINQINTDGDTALHLVCIKAIEAYESQQQEQLGGSGKTDSKDYYQTIEYLISKGALLYAPNSKNLTPYDLLVWLSRIDSRYSSFLSMIDAYYYEPGKLPADIFHLVLHTLNIDDIMLLFSTSKLLTEKYYLDGNSIIWKILYQRDISDHYPIGYRTNNPDPFIKKISQYSVKDLYLEIFKIYRRLLNIGLALMSNPYFIRSRIDELIKYSAEKYLLRHVDIIKKYYESSSKYLRIMHTIISNNMTNLFVILYELYGKIYSNKWKNKLLLKAIVHNNLILIEYLLNDGANNYYSSFVTAIQNDRIDLIHLFLNYYKDQLIVEEKAKTKTNDVDANDIEHILFLVMNEMIHNTKSAKAIEILFLDPIGPADDYTAALLHGIAKLNLKIVQWVIERANGNVNVNYAFNQIPDYFSKQMIQQDERLSEIIKYLTPLVTNDMHNSIS